MELPGERDNARNNTSYMHGLRTEQNNDNVYGAVIMAKPLRQFTQLQTHTHRTVCSTWTTKVIGNNANQTTDRDTLTSFDDKYSAPRATWNANDTRSL